jgi:hypothetical protein
MRASILLPLSKRRRSSRREHAPSGAPRRPADPAVQRVRRAGGPVDRALYSCICGHTFLAPVSTTVRCPHCSAAQAW